MHDHLLCEKLQCIRLHFSGFTLIFAFKPSSGATMTFFHLSRFLHRASTPAQGDVGAPRSWLDRLAQWSDRQPARPHSMGSYIV